MCRAFALLLCGVALSACSAIPRASESNRGGTVSLESNPPGAEARLSSSGAGCRTPCTLPVKVSDYNVTFTKDEASQLKAIFPKGVCDFSKPGVGQEPTESTWEFF